MAEELIINQQLSKEEKYQNLLPQLAALTSGETDVMANLANLMAALKQTFHFWWVGVYMVKNDELVLGPFQGPVACTRIKKGKGVCGAAWQQANTLIVPNVDEFPGHIACSSLSKSEIVIPVFNKNKEVIMVIDVDSEKLADFDQTDEIYLNKIANLISDFA
ncbi:MAG: GAF domain-containing protein [Flavobacteriales bacterium]|nr:GAF domain-containing protein [Flavobacteriales bacterium]MCW8913931.1 GAF domain-containing protein [Flavobacteriales bacterium]MCW8937269.1 GAF domain-containing protein [Flavobacteriales bacterium]MCW8939430.1 GAF domain-containing protein [Flavobacteriales bacterium]MCW8967215.1 GAF domain-containing protein [Flavobacteriales bacterium]